MAEDLLQGPAWNLSDEYTSFESDLFQSDLKSADKIIEDLKAQTNYIAKFLQNEKILPAEIISHAQSAFHLQEQSFVLLSSLITFTTCFLSVDGKNQKAKQFIGLLQKKISECEQAAKPLTLFLMQSPESIIEKYLDHKETKHSRYQLFHLRAKSLYSLDLTNENLITALSVDGLIAWGNLYDNLSALIQCDLNLPAGNKKAGIAQASSLLQSADEATRKIALQAIKTAWEPHAETCAAILNAIAGWRLELCKRRSTKKTMHFLTNPLHENHMSEETLNAMFFAVDEAKQVGHQAMQLMARAFSKKALDPWDLFAPAPKKSADKERIFSFAEAIELIQTAFQNIDPELSAFVKLLVENKWIEGSIGEFKRPGAYCITFTKSRNPRVYMTFAGGFNDVITLAHEIGHAFHSWVMRDLPHCQLDYPMNLAETASTFAETIVRNQLLLNAQTSAEKLPVYWQIAQSAEAFLLNIPARFKFEKEFYESREEKNISVEEFSELMAKAWKHYYGDTLTNVKSEFWQTKLHFYISELSFYNFPYTFGYLFSLGIYAQKEKLKDKFYTHYVNLLRDTGRLSAEELIKKHLDADITKPQFWNESISIIKQQLNAFENGMGV